MIDGGRGHVSAALQVLTAMDIDIPVAGMVKDDSHRTRGLVRYDGEKFIETVLSDDPTLYRYIGMTSSPKGKELKE